MAKEYKNLMSPLRIAGITVKNRYNVGAMGGGNYVYGEKGCYSDNGVEYFTDRARGGFGLVTTGSNVANLTVDPFDPINGNPNPLYAPGQFMKNALELTHRIHSFGGKIFMQISMGPGRMRDGKSCSRIPRYKAPDEMTEEMTVEEIETKINDMIKLAVAAKGWNFDGVEIHGMHWGYLLDQFAMAYTNHRTDEYGGDLDGRLTIHRKIIQGIKQAVGKDFPVAIRMCMKTYMAGYNKSTLTGEDEVGRTIEEAVEIAKRFEQWGIDMFDVNAGTYDTFYYCVAPYYMPKGFNLELAKKIKAAVSVPVYLAGNMDDPDMCEEAIENGWIDGVTLARASLIDPQYPNKVFAGKTEQIRPCMRCTNCIDSLLAGDGPRCSANPAAMREHSYAIPHTNNPKKVMVVGGGVAGMEAARSAKLAGHEVELYEAKSILGGHLEEAGSHPFKSGIADLNRWYQNELKLKNVPVFLNTPVNADMIKEKAPDVVILAVGSDHFMPPIPGHDHEKSVICYDALMGNVRLGEKIVVVGGGLTGTELAYDLAAYEHRDVTIVEALPAILSAGAPVQKAVKMMLTDLIEYNHVKIKTGNKISAVTDEGAVIENVSTGEKEVIACDNVIFAIGLKPKKSMANELLGAGIEVHEIGDARVVANILTSTSDAYEVVRKL